MNSYQNDLTSEVQNLSLNGNGTYMPPHLRNGAVPNYPPPALDFNPPQSNSYGGGRRGGFNNFQPRGGFNQPPPAFNNNGYNNNRRYNNNDRSFGAPTNRYQNRRNLSRDWSEQTPVNEGLERELFGSAANTGINFDEYETIPVNISGPNFTPKQIETNFEELNLHPILQNNINLTKYTKPTPVQKHSIPVVLGSRDLMACAQTGSGKTAAFLIPIFHNMFTEGPGESIDRYVASGYRTHYPVCLVLAPTRELAMQIQSDAQKFSYRSNVRATVAYGGVDIRSQINDFNRGCHMIVATPGRLIDHLKRGIISLECCRYLVLDEADRMLDLGFEPQIREIVRDHLGDRPRQTVMFSATFPNQIQMLAKDFLTEYVFLTVGRIGSTSGNITQEIHWVEEYEKKEALQEFLADSPTELVLVFVEQKRTVDELQYYLRGQRFMVTSMHGDKDQSERTHALESFRSGKTPILIATSVAARGLHVENISKVINYDLPNDIDDYVHRIGRTGRAGNTGKAISFCNEKNRNVIPALVELLQEAEKEVPEWMRAYSQETPRSKYGRGGARRGNGGNFGSRDYRQNGSGGGRGGNYGSYSNGGGNQRFNNNYGHDGGHANGSGFVNTANASIDNWYKNY